MAKPSKIPMHQNDDRQKEFSLMSKGLGANYITENIIKYHNDNLKERMYVNLDGGKKASMPRYYKNKIYSDYDKQTLNLHFKKVMGDQHDAYLKNPDYYRAKAESDLSAFKKFTKEANKIDRNKI